MKNILFLACSLFTVVAQAQTVLFTEDFESTLVLMTDNSTGTNSWGLNRTFQNGGLNSDSAQVAQGDTLILESNSFSTMGFSFVTLNFSQICKVDFFDKGIVEYSTNNGTSWTQLTVSDYTGSGLLNADGFSSISYSTWDIANGSAIPTNSWWKNESFDLSVTGSQMQVKIRFSLIDADNNGARSNYGWLLDDIEVIGSPCEVIPPSILQTGTLHQGAVFGTGPYLVEADIQDASGVASASVEYTVNGSSLNTLTMNNTSGNIYQATIPSAVVGDTICYTIKAIDNTTCSNNAQLPGVGCTQFIVNPAAPPNCIGNPVSSFNYSETFASFTPGNGRDPGGIGTLNNNWANSTTSAHEWWVYNTSTRSANTGPTGDHSPNDANYLYIEASGYNNQTAIINSPCYNFSGLSAPKFSFWYHMSGNSMGSLHLDVYNAGSWTLDVIPAIIGDQGNNWLFREVDFTPYAGTIIQVRFRGTTGGGFRSDIAIDDIEIIEPIAAELNLINFIAPNASSCNGSAAEFVTVGIENFGSQAQDTIPLAYQVNGGAVIRDTAFFNLIPAGVLNHTFQIPFNMSTSGTYSLNAWLELVSDGNFTNDSIIGYQVTTNSIQATFPDTTTFDNFTVGTPGIFLSDWSNNPQNTFDWFVNTGATPSGQTGPTGDTTSIAGSGNYVYYEATQVPQGEEGSFFSGCLDLNSTNRPEMKFYYHMSGIEMGELHLDLSLNGFLVQDIIPTITGDQGSDWLERVVDLTPYKGDVRVIFRAVRGAGYRSDIAVDQISLRDALPVGVGENDLSSAFSVFPNPVSNVLMLNANEVLNVEVVNTVGSRIIQTQVNTGLNQIDVSKWSKGVYFISVSDGKVTSTKKFIKQ
jgi:hypothetical protein